MTLPPQLIPGLKKLALLEESGFRELNASLRQIPPKMYRKDLSSNLKALLKSVPDEDVTELTYAIFSLNIGLATGDLTAEEFTSDIIQDVAESLSSLTEEEMGALKARVLAILQVDALKVGAKAQSVFFENERNLTEVRVLTDLRPVFLGKPSEIPAAALVLHNLKLTYLEKGQVKDFFVTMDSKDLQKVVDVLERAKQKQKSLIKGIGGASSLSIIEPE